MDEKNKKVTGNFLNGPLKFQRPHGKSKQVRKSNRVGKFASVRNLKTYIQLLTEDCDMGPILIYLKN